jgi:microcystin-dependent protein
MSQPFTGEVQMFGFSFAPRTWAQCNGQLLAIAQNLPLWNLIGSTYGGDGNNTMALPNLSGRLAMDVGPSPAGTPRQLGDQGGEEEVGLTVAEIPQHSHVQAASGEWSSNRAEGSVPAREGAFAPPDGGTLAPQALSPAGSSQAHDNMPPFLVLNFCIALTGTTPPPP